MIHKDPGQKCDAEVVSLMKNWQDLEDRAIRSASAMRDRTANPLLKMMMELIVHDSEKHRIVQQMIIDSLTQSSIHVSPDELNVLAGAMEAHVEQEEKALGLARLALEKCSLVSTHFLLSYLISDEEKHHSLMTGLKDLREASIPTSASARP